jgi:hypothetical protein
MLGGSGFNKQMLAQSNRSRTRGNATKKRARASAYRDAIPASVFGRLCARNKIGIGVGA